jgi:hypothetical protein
MSNNFTLSIGTNIELSDDKFNDLDVIICNKNNTKFKKENFNMKCWTYRKVRRIDKSHISYYIKIASSDIQSLDPTNETDGGLTGKKYFNFLIDNCHLDPNMVRIKQLYYADNNSIAYFNPITVEYHINQDAIEKKELTDFQEKNSTYFEVFKKAINGLLIYSIKKMKEIGIKVIIVDPKPIWSLTSINKTEKDKYNEVIKLYEEIGLTQLNCYFLTDSMKDLETETTPEVKKELRTKLGKNELIYDTTIMVGFIDDLYDQFAPYIGDSLYPSLASTFSSRAYEANIIDAVPKYLIDDFEGKELFTKDEMVDLKKINEPVLDYSIEGKKAKENKEILKEEEEEAKYVKQLQDAADKEKRDIKAEDDAEAKYVKQLQDAADKEKAAATAATDKDKEKTATTTDDKEKTTTNDKEKTTTTEKVKKVEKDKEKVEKDKEKVELDKEKVELDKEKVEKDKERVEKDKERLEKEKERIDKEKDKLEKEKERIEKEKEKIQKEKIQKEKIQKEKTKDKDKKIDKEKNDKEKTDKDMSGGYYNKYLKYKNKYLKLKASNV